MTHTDTSAIGSRIAVDDGFVSLTDAMGNDLSIVNAARVSFGKRKTELDEKDIKLIHYLAKHKHMSPFRHVVFSFTLENISEVVCRQLYKHQVGCAYTSDTFRETATTWNEISGRYVEFEPLFHIPAEFRKQDPNNKQASQPDALIAEPEQALAIYQNTVQNSYTAYKKLLELGVCKEQARMVLPMSFQNSLIWTASLEAVAHFVKLRKHAGAQLEIQKLAQAIEHLVVTLCPHGLAALLNV